MPDPVDGVYALEDWSNRWREGRAGWHLEGVHQMLSKYFASEIVQDRTDLKIFVPLCGKAKDLKWMHDQGHRIVGVEYDELVVRELFDEAGIAVASVEQIGGLQRFSSQDGRFTVYQGDFLLYKQEYESELMDGIWDRGSLVAINISDREKYASIITSAMSPTCRYLLDTLEYNVAEYTGVPHCVTNDEIRQLYDLKCEIKFLENRDALVERWKKQGMTRFEENVHLLSRK